MPWLRLYSAMPTDRKIRRLTPEHRWLWVCVLCLARQSPIPGWLLIAEGEPCHPDDLSDFAGLPARSVARGLDHMATLGMIARDDVENCWTVPNWDSRQFTSDTSTDRVRAHRDRTR